jgi:hypothetical protein
VLRGCSLRVMPIVVVRDQEAKRQRQEDGAKSSRLHHTNFDMCASMPPVTGLNRGWALS